MKMLRIIPPVYYWSREFTKKQNILKQFTERYILMFFRENSVHSLIYPLKGAYGEDDLKNECRLFKIIKE